MAATSKKRKSDVLNISEGYDWDDFVKSEEELRSEIEDIECGICHMVKRSAKVLSLNTDDGKFAEGW